MCPVCGSTTIRITTSVLVEYDLIYDGHSRDFSVIDELIGDAMWDEHSVVHCPVCAWHGTVADLRSSELQDS